MRRIPALCLLLAIAVAPVIDGPRAQEVTIYRCTGPDGRVSIGNQPCAGDERQEARGMVRPVDAPPPAVTAAPPSPEPAAPPPQVQVIVAHDPQPLFECTTPDGAQYESDDGEGNPRWVPFWTLGYPVGVSTSVGGGTRVASAGPGIGTGGSAGVSVPRMSGLSAPGPSGVSVPGLSGVSAPIPGAGAPPPRAGGGIHPPAGGHRDDYGSGGTWVRDDCRRLPHAEVCARLVDRRDDMRRRFFNAQQRERDVLRLRQREIGARLAQDCGVG